MERVAKIGIFFSFLGVLHPQQLNSTDRSLSFDNEVYPVGKPKNEKKKLFSEKKSKNFPRKEKEIFLQ